MGSRSLPQIFGGDQHMHVRGKEASERIVDTVSGGGQYKRSEMVVDD